MTAEVMRFVSQLVDKGCHHLVYSWRMPDPIPIIPARAVIRHYKQVFAQVTETNTPVIVAPSIGPKVAIISLETLEKLQQLTYKASAQTLLTLAQQARTLLNETDLPADLSHQHDRYLWQDDA
jgi:hypothetical protein